nr:MAG TPA: hypothetical protein [Caudoviricetes sp.]
MFGSDISCAYNVSIMCYSPPFEGSALLSDVLTGNSAVV